MKTMINDRALTAIHVTLGDGVVLKLLAETSATNPTLT
jgi:hypothetical protein